MRHKGDKGKSMMRALYVLRYAKRHSQDEATLNSEKIKPIALAVVKLCLPEGRQAGGQSGRQAGRQAGGRAGRQAGGRAGGQAGRQAGRQLVSRKFH